MEDEEILEDDLKNEDYEDLAPEYYENQSDYFPQNQEVKNKFFQNSYNNSQQNKGQQNRFSNFNKNTNQDSFLKNNIKKQAKSTPPKVNIANSKNGKLELPKDSNSKANAAKNIINSIHKNKSQIGDKLNSNKNAEDSKSSSGGKAAAKDAVEQLKQGGEAIAKNVVSKIITSRTGLSKAIADKLADFAVGNGKKIIGFLVGCGLLAIFMLVSVFADDESEEEKNESISSYYSGEISDEELFNSLADIGFIDSSYCIDIDNNFDDSCSFITFIKKIKDNTDTKEEFLFILYTISYERNFDEYMNSTEELDDLINNKTDLQTYLNGEYILEYRSDLSESFDLYSEILQIVNSNYDSIVYSGDEFKADPQTGFIMRINRAQRDNTFFYGTGQIEGECVWYVYGRANEILSSWGSTYKWTFSSDAGQLCYQNYVKRNSGNIIDDDSIEKIKQGDILSWYYPPWGHVAVVEKVNRDSSGKVITVEISEGGLGYYTQSSYNKGLINTNVVYKGKVYAIGDTGSQAARTFVNGEGTWPFSQPRRQALCESSGTGCQNYATLSRDQIKKINSSVSRSCIVALDAYK